MFVLYGTLNHYKVKYSYTDSIMCLIKNIDSLQLHTSLNWFIMQINKLINNHLLDAGLPIGRISSLAFMHARDGYTLLIARFAIFLIADGSHIVGVCVFVGRVRRAIAVSKRIDSDVHKREKQTRVSIVCKPLRHASSWPTSTTLTSAIQRQANSRFKNDSIW